jgi:hypothetical protein
MSRTVPIDVLGAVLCILFAAPVAAGDCGSIPFEPGVKVFEPDQRALIAWNGTQETLILSTDLSASKPTKVLEVIPLPGRPVVTPGDVKVFNRAIRLINEKLRRRAGRSRDKSSLGTFGSDDGGGAPPPPAGEVVFRDRIGATDVSVTHVLNSKGFVTWVEKYLKSLKVKSPEVPEPMKKVVAEYLADGYGWFVFNVVSLDSRTRTKQALRYRFESPCIYYPLRIMRTDTGETKVKLIVLTHKLINGHMFTGIPRSELKVPHEPITATWQELKRIDRGVFDFMGCPGTVRLRIWEIEGELSQFKQDLLAGLPFAFYLRRVKDGKTYGPFAFFHNAEVLIDSELFSLQAGDARHAKGANIFELRSVRFNSRHGPYRFVDGAKLVLGRTPFTLIKKKLPSPKRPARGRSS